MIKIVSLIALALVGSVPAISAWGGEVSVAVASNFAVPLAQLVDDFSNATGHVVRTSSGSTGKLYAQIVAGAPYHVFLAADEVFPLKLEQSGAAVANTRFTYAQGRLVLWSLDPKKIQISDSKGFEGIHLNSVAMANPAAAPYGAAALQVLSRVFRNHKMPFKIVQGENIAQAYQYASTGNVDAAFVARSQVWQNGLIVSGSAWEIPASLHEPIRQQAVLLSRAKDNPAALAFIRYLQSPSVKLMLRNFGYDVP